MAMVYSLDGITPVVHPTAYVHPSAVLIGDVIVGPGCYVGPSASLRGDFGRLIVEEGANIQDCCVMHGFPDTDTVVGPNGHIGHGAVIHCCQIGANAMVGMNAVVMDRAVIGESAMVAACAFVKAGMAVPPRTLAAGVPARVLRPLSEQELAAKLDGTALYQDLARRCLATMREAVALPSPEADRPRMRVAHIKPWVDLKMPPAESG